MKAGEAPLLLGYGPFFGHQLVDPLAEHEQLQQRLERQLGRQLQQLELQNTNGVRPALMGSENE